MSPANAAAMLQSYRNAGLEGVVNSASPQRLVWMLLDGAMTRLAMARSAMDSADPAQKGRMIGAAMSIVAALRGSLDLQNGGQIATNLESLYDYMNRRLLDASVRNERAAVDEVIGLVRELAGAWEALPVPAQAA